MEGWKLERAVAGWLDHRLLGLEEVQRGTLRQKAGQKQSRCLPLARVCWPFHAWEACMKNIDEMIHLSFTDGSRNPEQALHVACKNSDTGKRYSSAGKKRIIDFINERKERDGLTTAVQMTSDK
ncbi:MAG: hypothetical protein QM755_06295 [Luteolibacter sp.]